MRVNHITLGGVQYPLCYSLEVVRQLSEEYGSVSAFVEALNSGDFVRCTPAINTAITAMVRAGRVYCQLMSEDVPPVLRGKPSDMLEVSEFKAAALLVLTTIVDCSKQQVEVATNPNATATAVSPAGCGCKCRGDKQATAPKTWQDCRLARLLTRCRHILSLRGD